jgi:hypothetical protein
MGKSARSDLADRFNHGRQSTFIEHYNARLLLADQVRCRSRVVEQPSLICFVQKPRQLSEGSGIPLKNPVGTS